MAFPYAKWKKRIAADKAYQAERHEIWKRSLELYDMSYWRKRGWSGETTDSMVPVNYITTFVSTKVSAVYSRNPKMFVRARAGMEGRFSRFADISEDLLERYWDEQGLKEVFLEIVRDCILFGIGWAECGYLPSVREFASPETAEGGVKNRVEQFIESLVGRETKPEEPPSTQGVLADHQQPGEFFCLRRSPYDVLWPAGFHSYHSLPYLILRDRLRVEDFLANPRWKHKDRITPVTLPEPGQKKLQRTEYDKMLKTSPETPQLDDRRVIDLYHIWDRREMEVTTVSDKGEEPHAGPEDWPYFAEGFPAIPLMFNGIPDLPDTANAYPFSDVEPIMAQVIEKSHIRTQMVAHRKRANGVILVQKGSSTESEIRNYAEGSDAIDVVPVSNVGAIVNGPQIQLPPAIFQTEQAINSDLDRDSGLQLILADLARTAQIDRATVANIAQGNASLKTNYNVDRVEAFSKAVATFHVGLFWQYLSRKEVGEWLGRFPDEEEWPSLPVHPEDARKRIRQAVELRIEAGSTRPIQDDVLDRQQFIQAIRVMQAVSPDKFSVVENDVLAILMKKFREPQLENLLRQATSQSAQQEAQQENQLLLQGIPALVHERDDHAGHLAIHAQAAQSPQHQQVAHVWSQQGKVHPLDQHLLSHSQHLQRRQATQQGNAQSNQQRAQAPSATELTRGGMPTPTDIGGRAMNLGVGSGAESQGV